MPGARFAALIAGFAGCLLAAAFGAAEPPLQSFDFDADVSGSPPAGFELARTGRGAEGSTRPTTPSARPGGSACGPRPIR